ncbi:tRNA pseudouridine synthase B [Acidothermus cellulolyticus 11B]|uniref:tRNA pseudouridine synthase B n=1 Tax=Acidothermus cellulolyticus (strain ATCC 43068 / DSM 8971 / 11B) TaxID=351607 RepID=A0LV24_ACIC1|nr:tRNA pseudouridine(55) synthase TruB [Acidothermus cellulolyticus]ABK53284.1 tRNA pseudouridine synthase B [Acidothermus cellulolyticus 11B]
MPATDGLLVVDKPAGITSHDVVARVRRLTGQRRVGHAGTLDPMATGVLIVGVGKATRLLGYLSGCDKEYAAIIRLGMTTSTDDADGEPVRRAGVERLSETAVREALTRFVGEFDQRPPAFSAVKVAGRRAYARARAGEDVVLPARRVRVDRIELRGSQRTDGFLDLDVTIACSAGTYIRSLARDLGELLGVGGHLAALRRTRVGAFTIDEARTLDAPAGPPSMVSLADAARRVFVVREVAGPAADALRHGRRIPAAALGDPAVELTSGGPQPVAVLDPEGALVALVTERDGLVVPVAVFEPPG